MELGPWIRVDGVGHRLVRGNDIVSLSYRQEDDNRFTVIATTRSPVNTSRHGGESRNPHEVELCKSPNGIQVVTDLALAMAIAEDTDILTFRLHEGRTHVIKSSLLPKKE